MKNTIRAIWSGNSGYLKITLLLVGFISGVVAAGPYFPAPSFLQEYQTLITGIIAIIAAFLTLHFNHISRMRDNFSKEHKLLNELASELDFCSRYARPSEVLNKILRQMLHIPIEARTSAAEIAFSWNNYHSLMEEFGNDVSDGLLNLLSEEIQKAHQKYVSWVSDCQLSREYLDFRQYAYDGQLFEHSFAVKTTFREMAD